MTDQLEQDLRTTLADRASTVTVDPTSSEQVIADRLRAGDAASADVVPFVVPSTRRRWLAPVAAAAVLVVLGVAAVVAQDDPDVTTGSSEQPAIPLEVGAFFFGNGTAEEVAIEYLEDRLQGDARALDLVRLQTDEPDAVRFSWTRGDATEPSGGVVGLVRHGEGWAVVEAFSDGTSIDVIQRDGDHVVVRTTAPPDRFVHLGVYTLDGGAVTAGGCGGAVVGAPPSTEPVTCEIDQQVEADGAPLTVRLSVVTQEGVRLGLEERLLLASDAGALADPEDGTTPTTARAPSSGDAMVGVGTDDHGSVKDVAEAFTRDVLGVEYVTTDVQQFDGLWEVTLEGEGNVLVASVPFDEAIGRFKLVSLHHPDVKLQLDAVGDSYVVTTPTGGELTITTYDGSPGVDPASAEVVVEATIDGAGTQHGPYDLPEAPWVRMDLVTDDGQVLRFFSYAAAGWL